MNKHFRRPRGSMFPTHHAAKVVIDGPLGEVEVQYLFAPGGEEADDDFTIEAISKEVMYDGDTGKIWWGLGLRPKKVKVIHKEITDWHFELICREPIYDTLRRNAMDERELSMEDA